MLLCADRRFGLVGNGRVMDTAQDGIAIVNISIEIMLVQPEVQRNRLQQRRSAFFKIAVGIKQGLIERLDFIYRHILGIFRFDGIVVFNGLAILKKFFHR